MGLSSIALPLRLAAFFGAVGVLLWLSLAPASALPPVTFWDKAEHALAYLALAGLGLACFPRRAGVLTLGLLVLGVVIEVLQANMGFGRQGDWRDAVADGLGTAAALGLFALRRTRAHRP